MLSLAVGTGHAASLHVGHLLGIRALLVLFRIIVRAVIRVNTSTESGLLQKQTDPFTLNGGQSAIAGYRLRQGIFSVFITGNLRSRF